MHDALPLVSQRMVCKQSALRAQETGSASEVDEREVVQADDLIPVGSAATGGCRFTEPAVYLAVLGFLTTWAL